MSNQPREGRVPRSVSLKRDRWEVGEQIAEDMDTSRNAVLEQLYDWWLRLPGAELPERAPAETIERRYEEWKRKHAWTPQEIRRKALTTPCPNEQCGAVEGPCRNSNGERIKRLHAPRLQAAEEALNEAGA